MYDCKVKMFDVVYLEDKIWYVIFNFVVDKVVFVYGNNFYYKDLVMGKII